MNLNNLFRIAWRAILLNKTRTLLTMLGIIIGVGSVITMLAIGEGSKKSIKENISKMGTNMLNIRPGAGMFGGVRNNSDMQSLKLTDYLALKKEAKLLKYVTPVVSGNGQAIVGANNWPTSIYGVNTEYLPIREWEVEEGAMFGQDELDNLSKVAVIGRTIQKNLFPDGDSPIGQTIRFKNIPFKIIGILAAKGDLLPKGKVILGKTKMILSSHPIPQCRSVYWHRPTYSLLWHRLSVRMKQKMRLMRLRKY